MKIFPKVLRLWLIIPAVVLFTAIMPEYTQADEYKWLKTKKYEKIFVYTDFTECDLMADKLNEAIKRILLRYDIKPTISNSLVFQQTQQTDKQGKSAKELLDDEMIAGNKIIMYIYGKCMEYKSVYIYQFDIYFGVIDKKTSQALLYSSPRQSVMGADTISGIDRKFRKLMEDATADYISANRENSK